MNDCIGVILAGGLARRMGGGDKPLVEIAGRPILQHVVDRLKPQCARLAINANGDPARFSAFGLPVICDSVEGFAGPLAGVLAGMDYGAGKGAAHVLSAPGDTPFLPADLLSRLQAARTRAGAAIAVAASNGRTHHAVALWPVALREDLRRALVAEDERRVSAFIGRYANVVVDWPIEPYDPFFNVNRPEDLARADAIAKEEPRS
ncbi:molybdenum cofactor guanylyltransferase MobA [Methylocystis sp. H62]|uniref:molybdenum cofactor guanylyltransferase MobA n=1 Tax=Methylocystis sp. H62 TaxID=2785789 RepID=UPI0018C34611|nr:molybdenum cofactor guanylyltransferase MobA [Methylocystis sp. H62]MBG0793752.1 molybdenum cofactor guanylyltransferase MobA [Methylocystis sp. H62]